MAIIIKIKYIYIKAISKNAIDRSIRLFEPEKLAFQEKYAFRRTVDSKPSNRSKKNKPVYSSFEVRSEEFSDMNFNRRSVKEFSHFDWSKVALEVQEDESINSNGSNSSSNQLPQIVTVRFM